MPASFAGSSFQDDGLEDGMDVQDAGEDSWCVPPPQQKQALASPRQQGVHLCAQQAWGWHALSPADARRL